MGRPPLMLWVGAGLVGLLVLCALLSPWIAPYSPTQVDASAVFKPPSASHWAGTDGLGRDMFSRILHGARPSLFAAFGLVAIGLVGGGVLGASAAILGGVVETLTMRLTEIVMALPGLVIALVLTAALGPSLVNLVIALGLLSIPFYTRIVRGEVVTLRELGYVRSAQVLGAGTLTLVFRHIAPNLAPILVTYGSLGLSAAILATSALSFIGLGAQPPTAEWGALIYDGSQTLLSEWWIAIFPGLAILVAAIGFTLLGDGLRDWLDPKGAT